MKINQLLWVIDAKTNSVVPVKIIEKVTKETSTGVESEFIVETLTQKRASLNQIQGRYFESLDEARKMLIVSATNLIDSVIEKARTSSVKFGPNLVQLDHNNDTIPLEPVDDFITLPDGSLARVRIKT
jgi:hypothetical protein